MKTKISFIFFGILHAYFLNSQITVIPNFNTLGAYDVYELSIQHPQSYPNNWEDVTVTSVFTGPYTFTIDGFYYNTNVWKVRFAPPETGIWTYDLTFVCPSGTYTANGTFTCNPSANKGFLLQHPANPFRLIFPDGTLFNGIGIGDCINDGNMDGTPHNDWGFDGDFRPPSPSEGDRTDLNTYMSSYGASGAGFNLFRWSINNCAFNLYDSLTVNGNAYLIREGIWGDSLVQALRQNGFRLWTSFFGFFPPFPNFTGSDSPEEIAIEKYIRYVVARYGAYTDIWELYNEATTSDHWIYEIVPFVHSIDQYHRLIATSWERPDHPDIDINAPHWYEKESEFQSDERAWAEISAKKSWDKPIIFGEQGNSVQNWDPQSALRMRIRSWTAFFAEGIFIFWNSTFAKDYLNPIAANIYLGPEERGYVRALQDFTAFADSSVRQMTITPSNPVAVKAYALQSPEIIMAYFHHFNSHTENISTSFNLTLPQEGTVYWINPADNMVLESTHLNAGTQTISSPTFTIDLAMRINFSSTATNQASNLNPDIKIFPNPSTTEFYISGNYSIPSVFELFDMMGEKILHEIITSDHQKIFITGYAKGCYFYKIITHDRQEMFGKILLE